MVPGYALCVCAYFLQVLFCFGNLVLLAAPTIRRVPYELVWVSPHFFEPSLECCCWSASVVTVPRGAASCCPRAAEVMDEHHSLCLFLFSSLCGRRVTTLTTLSSCCTAIGLCVRVRRREESQNAHLTIALFLLARCFFFN